MVKSTSWRDPLVIILATLGLTLLVWLPHYLRLPNFYALDFSTGFANIYRNYDGINYIVIAKSLYDPQVIASLPQTLPANYYAAHFPGYSLLILSLAPLLGFLKSMLVISLLFTVLSAMAFYYLLKSFDLTKQPLWLSLVFLILPARWLVVHSVGSAEPIFIFFTIMAIHAFMKFEQSHKNGWIWLFGLWGILAQLTRPPGILLFIAIGLYLVWKYFHQKTYHSLKQTFIFKWRYLPIILIPLTLLLIFSWYGYAYNDFWAYFHSGDNIHLTFPPFQVFNQAQYWVGEIWLEDIIYILILGYLGGMMLFKQKLYPMAFYVFTYLIAASLVAHRDISRYTLPVFPFVLIAFEKVLTTKEFKIVLAIVAVAIYLYSQNFLIANTAPVPELHYFD